jgi:urease accessory protein
MRPGGDHMVVRDVLGNASDAGWSDRLSMAHVDELALDQWEAQKNRLRKPTQGGIDIALALDRGRRLRDGDILSWDESSGSAIVAHVILGEVMVVELGGLATEPADIGLRSAVELGHAIGNQHWPAVITGTRVHVPVTVDRKVMDAVMRTHDLPGITHEFVPGTDVIAYLAPHEARRLFGGADTTPHSHAFESIE